MGESCADCPEMKRLTFELKGIDLEVTALQRETSNRDVEHDAVIQGVATRINNMEQKFTELKDEVKADIKSIKDEIPAMFENAINKLMARVLKWMLVSVGSFLGIILLIVLLAFSRPYIVNSLQELLDRTKTIEVER